MIVKLSAVYKFVCDRCGKEMFPDENGCIEGVCEVTFTARGQIKDIDIKKGQICEECFAEFCEIANNFFDDVNREVIRDA
jgi:hypothetical protein